MIFKRLINYAFLFCTIVFGAVLTSCTFTEKIVIEEDGSGTFNMDMDMSKFMDFANSMKDSSDSTEALKVKAEVIDSVIYFSDVLEAKKDSISQLPMEEQLVLQSLKDAKMKMHVDTENGKMLMNFIYDFEEIAKLRDVEKKISKAYSFSKNKESGSSSSPNNTTYTYTSKSFKRTVTAIKMTKKDRAEYDKNMDQMAMFFSGSTYNIEYHFPNKIKNTTAKNATFSDDKKILYISYPFDELLQDESVLDFEVNF